ncbi:MAG: DUF3866 family protein [Coriobacteriia bacterium]
MRLAWARVVRITDERPGFQRLAVECGGTGGTAIAYTALSGVCAAGERVLLNTTAVDLDLGTGGAHFVVARDVDGVALDDRSPGHIMKLRYTPLQRDVLAVEERASEHADTMTTESDLGGMPVVCCGLHSQVLPAAASIKAQDPVLRVAYVMTDGASLPLALSDAVAAMRGAGLLDATVTAGQAFGGDYEAVTLHSALLAARHVVEADIAIVALGPGITGTATPFGHGGVAAGEAVNAAGALGGRPVAVLRLSFTDTRERHHGVSHHSLIALGRVALAPAVVAVPVLPPVHAHGVESALEQAGVWRRHAREDVGVDGMPDTRGVPLRSMGRSPEDDPVFFAAACAGGIVAARMCSGD